MGHRPFSPDSLAMIDHSCGCANVYYTFSHGHAGLSGAPMTGRLIVEMVARRKMSLDPTPFQLGRVCLNRVIRSIVNDVIFDQIY